MDIKSSDDYIRGILNDGFLLFLKAALAVTVIISLLCYWFEFYSDAIIAASTIPFIIIAALLTRKGTVWGILLIIFISALGSALSIGPTATYSGPAVSIFLIIAPLIATRFLEPEAGLWALFLQLFLLIFAMVVKDISGAVAVRYSFFAAIDLTLITVTFMISSSILRHALATTYENETELQTMYDDVLLGWTQALELRNKETKGHTDRVTRLTLRIGTALGLNDSELLDIRRGAIMHDIGKTGIPDSILLKQGPLSGLEIDIMRLHPTYAYQWLRPFQRMHKSLEIPYSHHEKWDGSGYPRGLKGKDIPLSARIFAMADVYDALTSSRPYRGPMPREQALQYIVDRAGKDFDPALVPVFLEQEEKLNLELHDNTI